MKMNVSFEGDLARALAWEARRRGIDAADLVRKLVRDSSCQIITTWRQVHWGVRFLRSRDPAGNVRSFQEVVQKARGPARS